MSSHGFCGPGDRSQTGVPGVWNFSLILLMMTCLGSKDFAPPHFPRGVLRLLGGHEVVELGGGGELGVYTILERRGQSRGLLGMAKDCSDGVGASSDLSPKEVLPVCLIRGL